MQWYNNYKQEIDSALESFFDQYRLPQAETPEKTIKEACEYATLNQGKRVRGVLALLCFDICKTDQTPIDRFQATKSIIALELIHAYSLVHDDLPAMDNDEMRRGKSSTWKAYGESTGILTGDTLNTIAFEAIAEHAPDYAIRPLIQILASKSGINGMIGGQMRDLYFEDIDHTLEQLIETHRKKTGELIIASAMVGSILAKCSHEKRKLVEQYAEKIGLTFQIKDDILDVEGNEKMVGKKLGKDAAHKGFIKLVGLEQSKQMIHDITEEACRIAEQL
ncbi:MAG: polyprenyl synthetase family protein [Patescibacteria group bacterium]|nr:polyprenyl synthetase family protein [Patescibacteria group bacterium]